MTNEELVARIKAGIDVSDNMLQLWQNNKGYIYKLANKYKGQAEMDDLMQEGYLGLCQGVDGYDPGQGVKFLSYASNWIQQKMQRYVYSNGTVRISEHKGHEVVKYKRFLSSFYLQVGREPLDRETRYYLGLSWEELVSLKKAAQMASVGSLDTPISEDGELTLRDTVSSHESVEDSVLDKVQGEQLKSVIWGLVNELPGEYPEVVKARFVDGLTLDEVGKRLGTTGNAARQHLKNALGELRKPSRSRQLLPFRDDYIASLALKGNGVRAFKRTWTSSTEHTAMELIGMGL